MTQHDPAPALCWVCASLDPTYGLFLFDLAMIREKPSDFRRLWLIGSEAAKHGDHISTRTLSGAVNWIPACMPEACLRHDAGMTPVGCANLHSNVTPAQAGAHAPGRTS